MKLFRKYKTLWMASFVVVLAILFITNFSYFAEGFKYVLSAFTSLMGGVALAFILNLIMAPVEEKLRNCNVRFFAQNGHEHLRCCRVFSSPLYHCADLVDRYSKLDQCGTNVGA